METKYWLEICPVPKPRQTQSDKWKKRSCVVRYRQYADALREKIGNLSLAEKPGINFVLPMPLSWSKTKKQKMNGQPHRQKPDLDNLIKGFLDALYPKDDSFVWFVCAQKIWGYQGGIGLLTSREPNEAL